MAQFLVMGGYAAFVWPAYGITFAGIGAAIFLTLRAYARARSVIAELESGDTG
jgi:heme exporter protein CcmD